MARDHAERLLSDGRAAARAAGLRWIPTDAPGLRRVRRGRGFVYRDARGRPVTAARTLARIGALAIPPAWRDVWISADPRGHVQAWGRDARGRKQFRYHPRWREVRERAKHRHVRALGRVLPRLRAAVERDLRCACLCREAVCAAIVLLVDRGRLRIGNDEYARANDSHGACTLEDGNVHVGRGATVRFAFAGKGKVRHAVAIEHPALARVVRRCRALPGRRLFQYEAPGERRAVTARDVNAYLRDRTRGALSAKDLRTWHASRLCARLLAAAPPPPATRARKRAVTAAVAEVAAQLGNTPAVCRKSYIDPDVIADYLAA